MNGCIKICGLTDPAGVAAALSYGADLLGFVFRKESQRYVGLDAAGKLRQAAKTRARCVAVVCDPDNEFLEALISRTDPDILQLHGGEPPRRAAEISARFKRPVFKALGISCKEDLETLKPYEDVCEKILLESKSPKGLPAGGTGRAFDWQLVALLPRRDHILLAGGLTPENVAEAITCANVRAVDVSSGIESAPGIKDRDRISRFVTNARTAFAVKQASSLIA